MEASLTCAVCLGVFRDPVTLPLCSHNFCKNCVEECAEPQNIPIPPGSSVAVTVPCPLCRKVSSIRGGLTALPVNTTLAELTRLLTPSREASKEELLPQDAESQLTDLCPEHPEHRLELFCRSCVQACCGKCVTAAHQGIFHSVNLLEMVYQEEKLMFFNSFKRLREKYEKVKEDLDDYGNIKKTLQKNIEVVNSAFDRVQSALDLKKQKLLDFIKQQESTAMKRHEVWKRTKEHYNITLEHLLKDSEALVDEVEPKCFLKASCSLNKRMKSHLDLMDLTASHCNDAPKPQLNYVDINPVVIAISNLNVTAAVSNDPLPSASSEDSSKTLPETSANLVPTQKYKPVQNRELCYLQGQLQKLSVCMLSITEMPEYKHLSFEELRMNYYEDSAMQENHGVSLTEEVASVGKDNLHIRSVDAKKQNCTKVKRPAGLGGSTCMSTSKLELAPKTTTENEPGKKDASFPGVFTFSKVLPVSGFLKGETGGVPVDLRGANKETNSNSVVPVFYFGRSEAPTVSNPCMKERECIQPKTNSVGCSETLPSTSKPVVSFSNTGLPKDTSPSPFCSPFSHQEPNAEENKDLAALSNSSEEFYDAVSNASSDPEETTMSSNAG